MIQQSSFTPEVASLPKARAVLPCWRSEAAEEPLFAPQVTKKAEVSSMADFMESMESCLPGKGGILYF